MFIIHERFLKKEPHPKSSRLPRSLRKMTGVGALIGDGRTRNYRMEDNTVVTTKPAEHYYAAGNNIFIDAMDHPQIPTVSREIKLKEGNGQVVQVKVTTVGNPTAAEELFKGRGFTRD